GWTSPTGRHYQSEHQDWEPPQWPPQLLGPIPDQDQGHSPAVAEDQPFGQQLEPVFGPAAP
ncbi:hypothetical protein V9L19_13920, partial [Pseudarthrobacter sp. CCNWLW247]